MFGILIDIVIGIVMIIALIITIYFHDWRSQRCKTLAFLSACAALIAFIESHWIIGIILIVGMVLFIGLAKYYNEEGDEDAIRGSKILGAFTIASLITAIITFFIGSWGWGILFSALTILWGIGWLIYHFFCAVGELAGAVVQDVVELIKVIINEIINRRSVKDAVRQKCPGALKTQILEAKKRAVTVGVFGKNNQKQTMEISSDCGVDYDEIYEGETIDLRA